jgi:hypothetical protein
MKTADREAVRPGLNAWTDVPFAGVWNAKLLEFGNPNDLFKLATSMDMD